VQRNCIIAEETNIAREYRKRSQAVKEYGQAMTPRGRNLRVDLTEAIEYTPGFIMDSYSTHGDVVFRWLVTGRLRTLRAVCWPDGLL